MLIEGIAGEFPSLGSDVVAARNLRRDSQRLASPGDHRELPGQVVVLLPDQKGKVEVSHVVVHRSAAGETAGQKAPVLLQLSGAAFLPGVLVAADDHGVAVLPQVKDTALLVHCVEEIFLQGQIVVGVSRFRAEDQKVSDHQSSSLV